MKPFVLILLYLVAVTSPLVFSWMFGGAPRPLRHELGSGLGMLAFSMILAEFVLSGRFKSISNGIGMDVTMRFHQVMARTALVFALVHPFLFRGALTGDRRPWDPTRHLTVTGDFPDLVSGIAAFLLLPTLVLLAIGRNQLSYKYETWRLMHGIGAFLIAALLLHHALSAGRYGAEPALVWLWLAMTGAAAGSLLYVYVVVPLQARTRPWRVVSVNRLTPRQWELTVAPNGHAGMDYKAGQFVWLNIGHSPFTLHENPFSISSAPASGSEISFFIKELGDFTRALGQIRTGTRAYLDGPYGNLSVEARTEPGMALIAGGVGLAPLLAIHRQTRLTNDPRRVKLIYGNRRAEQIAFGEELAGKDVVHVLSEPPQGWHGETGLIDAALLDRVLLPEHFNKWLFVLCGPATMMDTVERHLLVRGTPSHRILSERFEYD